MLFNKRNKQLEDEINENFMAAHRHTSFVEEHLYNLTDAHNDLSESFANLKDELATNGVIRDIRKLQKQMDAVESAIQGMLGAMNDKFDELDNNGVATAINKLNKEVFDKRKLPELSVLEQLMHFEPDDEDEEATLAGKVDAIIAHLGIDVTVQPEEIKPAEVVAKKKKAVKKKGKK